MEENTTVPEESKEIVPATAIPVFTFDPKLDETEETPPIRRQIGKTMSITENFTLYDVFKYVGQVDKKIKEFRDGIEALEAQRKNYMDEVALIEQQLGVSDLEAQYQKVKAEEAVAKEIESRDNGNA